MFFFNLVVLLQFAQFNLNAHFYSKMLQSSEIAMFSQFSALCRHSGAFIVKIADIPSAGGHYEEP